ncbi:phage holin family protein [Cohnella pontilimi]|uniref:Phage holin family protein n=1 Tax=Cohnella pontilimi TaxID=2564100 RepID=A0A4U0FFC5_9BACL|nr:phage holin family protein [Cohnella pontilimi]TJY43551.1 phage holin family protein [Cohnella pontilimi]
MQLHAASAVVILGGAINFAFGIWPEALTLLVFVMGLDYISGVLAAVKSGDGLNSNIGFWGLAKKGLTLLVIMLSHRIDVLLGMNLVMGGAISFYLVNELLSVVENCGELGIPIPDNVRRIVQILRDKTD